LSKKGCCLLIVVKISTANDLPLLYQAGKHRYFQLICWDEWQTLGNKKTLSKYPAPPNADANSEEGNHHPPASPRIFPKSAGRNRENPEYSGKTPSQLNQIESNLTEDDGEENDASQRGKHPQNVAPFPTPHHNVANNENGAYSEANMPTTQAEGDPAKMLARSLSNGRSWPG